MDDCLLLITYIYPKKKKEKEVSLFYSTEYLTSYFFQGKEDSCWVQTIAFYLYWHILYHILHRCYNMRTVWLRGSVQTCLSSTQLVTTQGCVWEGNETKDIGKDEGRRIEELSRRNERKERYFIGRWRTNWWNDSECIMP